MDETGGMVVGYIGHVDLVCEECGEAVELDEELLCPCGKGLCADCIVLGSRVDTCAACAERSPRLTLVRGGR